MKAEGDIYAFARTQGEEAAVVALNRGKAQQAALPAAQFADGTVFTDALQPEYSAAVADGVLLVDLAENQGRMMIRE